MYVSLADFHYYHNPIAYGSALRNICFTEERAGCSVNCYRKKGADKKGIITTLLECNHFD